MSKKINLKENAPVGSFEYVRNVLSASMKTVQLFKDVDYYSIYLMYVYPEKIIVSVKDKYYEIPYEMAMDFSQVVWGKPVEVEQYYAPKDIEEANPVQKTKEKTKVVKESQTVEAELKEAGISVSKREDKELNFEFISLKEGTYDPETGELEVVIVEAGTNEVKKRHYPDATVKEAAPIFKGMKMYLNHPTKREEMEIPERDITKWASTIIESYPGVSATGRAQVRGKVVVHDSWLRDRLKDSVAREHIGLSILTGGKVAYGKVAGQDMQIVEKILPTRQNGPASVDWVTEAGARGRVSRLLKETSTKEKIGMELKEATFADLQRENPALLTSITEHVQKTLKESDEAKAKEQQLKESQEENKRLKAEKVASEQKGKIDALLKESKAPQPVKDRVAKMLSGKTFEDEAKLKESFEATMKEELEYFNKFSSKGKINLSEGDAPEKGNTTLQEATARLSGRLGLKEDTKEEKK